MKDKSKPMFMNYVGILQLLHHTVNYKSNAKEDVLSVKKAMQLFFRRSAERLKRNLKKTSSKIIHLKQPVHAVPSIKRRGKQNCEKKSVKTNLNH